VSLPPWDSFNLGDHVGDDPAAVARNRQRLAAALPDGTTLHWLRQVHGAQVVEAGLRSTPVADGCWTRRPLRACAVLTADCLPVLFCDRAGSAVAAAHAGWRGLAAGILEATVAAMPAPGSAVLAWLGPAIGPAAFEVGPEVRERFLDAAPVAEHAALDACFRPSASRRGRLLGDLYGLARQRLRRAGVSAVFGGGCCTFTDAARFFSYRRDVTT
jgi:YfiH family protein